MPLLIPLMLAGGGIAALGITAGYTASGGVRATSDATKYATILALGIGALWAYNKFLK